MRLRLGVVGIMVVPAALAFAACGSSSPSSSDSTTTTASAGATTTTSADGSTTTSAGGSTTTAGTTGTLFDSCSVVTKEEAAAALGETVSDGISSTVPALGALACVFYGPSAPTPTTPNAAQPDTVRVAVVKGDDAATQYDAFKATVAAPQEISGYGDEAFYDGTAVLSVLKGDTYLRIAVRPAGGSASALAADQQLATAVLANL